MDSLIPTLLSASRVVLGSLFSLLVFRPYVSINVSYKFPKMTFKGTYVVVCGASQSSASSFLSRLPSGIKPDNKEYCSFLWSKHSYNGGGGQ